MSTWLLVGANVAFFLFAPGWTPVVFSSDGWVQLLASTLFLAVFGRRAEDRFGLIRFVLFYLLCGYVAALVGHGSAAGAVSGVLGAYLVLYPRARAGSLARALWFLPERLPAWLALGGWFAVQWLHGTGYAWTAALGFVVGVFAAQPLLKRRPPFAEHRVGRRLVSSRSSGGTAGRAAGSGRGNRSGRGTGNDRGSGGAVAGPRTSAGGA